MIDECELCITLDNKMRASERNDLHSPGSEWRGRVLVIGSVNLDFVTRVKTFPRPGETLLGSDYETHHGGKGANQAVAAARMGADVTFVGRVGKDHFGGRLRSGLEDEGIDVAGLAAVEAASGAAFITLDDSGQNTIIVAPGANARLRPDDLAADTIRTADVVVLQLEIPTETVKGAISLARKARVKVIVNAAPAGTMSIEDLQGCDVLVVNETEAATLLGVRGTADPERLADALAESFPAVVITLGSQGVIWRVSESGGVMAPHAVDVVDTTAAGDAFVGAVAAGLGNGLGLEEAVRWGNAAGALAVGRAGAQPSLPRFEAVVGLISGSS